MRFRQADSGSTDRVSTIASRLRTNPAIRSRGMAAIWQRNCNSTCSTDLPCGTVPIFHARQANRSSLRVRPRHHGNDGDSCAHRISRHGRVATWLVFRSAGARLACHCCRPLRTWRAATRKTFPRRPPHIAPARPELRSGNRDGHGSTGIADRRARFSAVFRAHGAA